MELYNKKYFAGSRKFQKDGERLTELAYYIMRTSPKKVLDVGCGLGFLVNKLRDLGVEAHGVDFALALKEFYWDKPWFSISEAKNLPFKDKEFDVVFSSDFLEHLPEENIDVVVSEMKRVGKVVLARVAYEDKLTQRQAMYHLTNKPEDWWKEKLKGVELV